MNPCPWFKKNGMILYLDELANDHMRLSMYELNLHILNRDLEKPYTHSTFKSLLILFVILLTIELENHNRMA